MYKMKTADLPKLYAAIAGENDLFLPVKAAGQTNFGLYTENAQVDIDTLFKTSDIISIHSPLNEKTENLVNKEKLSLMKREAVIINVVRGAIINSEDLVWAVDTGVIKGAGIDVYPTEPPCEDDPFMRIKHPERFVLTPHIAWASLEARQRCVDIVGENIKAFIEQRGCNDVW